ncbi:MAG TPA: hypothetical protein VFJ64_10830 [Solirubrobacterales bacterium]|nr:hypothetical protein [Solirubrobacterales bacterium]
MSRDRDNYNAGAELTWRIVQAWQGERPRFAFPPRNIALIADLRDIGERLARNDAAKKLVALLIDHCVKETGQAPTAMMLRVVLEQSGIPIEYVAPSELGLAVPRA